MPVPAPTSSVGWDEKPSKSLPALWLVTLTLTETTLGLTVLAILLMSWLSLDTTCFCTATDGVLSPPLLVAPSQPPRKPMAKLIIRNSAVPNIFTLLP